MSEATLAGFQTKEEYTVKNWHLFLFVLLSNLIITLINDRFIMTKDVYYLLLSDKIESNRVDDYFELTKRFSLYSYLALPIIIWLKITFVALVLQTPLMLKGIEVSFKETFKISAFANIPYVLLAVIKTSILLFTPRSNYTNDLLNMIPGSLTNFISKESYSNLAYSFLNNINLYEILWVLIVFYGIGNLKKISKADSFILVVSVWFGLTILQLGLVFYFNKV